jgi:hypothetical protein
MRKSRYSDEQMVAILREADRTTVAEAAKKHKISEPTIYSWRKHFGHLEVADVKRLKSLEQGERSAQEAAGAGYAKTSESAYGDFRTRTKQPLKAHAAGRYRALGVAPVERCRTAAPGLKPPIVVVPCPVREG